MWKETGCRTRRLFAVGQLDGRLSFMIRVFQIIGITLFVLSFLVPSTWGAGEPLQMFGGCIAFISAPYIIFLMLAKLQFGSWHDISFFLELVVAWTANFTIFLRPRLIAALVGIFSLLVGYICLYSITVGKVQLYFYPWALGILLIHLSRILKSWPH